MPDPDPKIVTCPECLTEFKVPGNSGAPGESSCPMCGVITSSPPESSPSGNIEAGSKIPIPKKALNIDLPDMIIRNANQKKHEVEPGENSSPELKHIPQKFKAADAATPTVKESSARKSLKSRAGWDTEEGEEEDPPQPAPEASGSNPKIRFKTVPRKKKYSVKARLLFLLAILCMITALWMRPDPGKGKPDPEVATAGKSVNKIPPVQEPVKEDTAPVNEATVLSPIRQAVKDHGIREFNAQATEAVRTFLEAGELNVRKTVTRAIERVEPLMREYYTSNYPGPIKYKSISDYRQSLVTDEFCVMEVILHDSSKVTAVVALEEGSFVVDWESFVGYSEMTLAQFMKEQPKEPTLFRVRIEFDDYFNFDFTDKTHRCLRLSDLNRTNVIYGYVRMKSELLPKLKQGKEILSIVRIRYPENPKSSNQVLIDEVITHGWVLR